MFQAKSLPYEEGIVMWLLVEVSSRVLMDASQSKGWLSCFRKMYYPMTCWRGGIDEAG